jgi:hypothetical protein
MAMSLATATAALGPTACSSSSSGDKPSGGNEAAVQTGDASAVGVTDSGGSGSSVEASSGDDDSGDDGASSCQTGSYASDTYAPNLTKVGKPASGAPDDGGSASLTFVLTGNQVSGAASPPLEPYTNTFTLKLLDASGQPVTDATVTLPTDNQALGWPFQKDPWMPLHQHGSSIVPTVTNNGDGTYAVSTYFFMAGLWQIYFVAQTATVTDSAMFSFCLQ